MQTWIKISAWNKPPAFCSYITQPKGKVCPRSQKKKKLQKPSGTLGDICSARIILTYWHRLFPILAFQGIFSGLGSSIYSLRGWLRRVACPSGLRSFIWSKLVQNDYLVISNPHPLSDPFIIIRHFNGLSRCDLTSGSRGLPFLAGTGYFGGLLTPLLHLPGQDWVRCNGLPFSRWNFRQVIALGRFGRRSVVDCGALGPMACWYKSLMLNEEKSMLTRTRVSKNGKRPG